MQAKKAIKVLVSRSKSQEKNSKAKLFGSFYMSSNEFGGSDDWDASQKIYIWKEILGAKETITKFGNKANEKINRKPL